MRIQKDNKQLTPKQYAEEILISEVTDIVQEWYTKQNEVFGIQLSEKEIEAINDQMCKIGNRLAKVLHFNVNYTEMFND